MNVLKSFSALMVALGAAIALIVVQARPAHATTYWLSHEFHGSYAHLKYTYYPDDWAPGYYRFYTQYGEVRANYYSYIYAYWNTDTINGQATFAAAPAGRTGTGNIGGSKARNVRFMLCVNYDGVVCETMTRA